MKQALSILICLCLLRPAEAQQAPTKVVGKRISYVSSVPALIRQRMPQGATTCFYGSTRLSASSSPLLLHLYNPDPKQQPDHSFGEYRLGLHIFSTNTLQKGTRNTPRFLNSADVVYRTLINKPSTFAAQLLWLDPKQKSKPILKFDCFVTDGGYGAMGDNVLVVFAEGIKRKPVVQSLAFGSWFASDSTGQETTFNTVDEKGLLELQTSLYGAGESASAKWILRWNQKGFHPLNGLIEGMGLNGLPYP